MTSVYNLVLQRAEIAYFERAQQHFDKAGEAHHAPNRPTHDTSGKVIMSIIGHHADSSGNSGYDLDRYYGKYEHFAPLIARHPASRSPRYATQ